MCLLCLRVHRDIVGERAVLFRQVDFQQLVYRECGDAKSGSQRSGWSYVKKKYKLNMPFLRLAYPAKASAFSSNAA